MTTHHDLSEDSVPELGTPVELEAPAEIPADSGTISFKISRQRLVIVALGILVVVSVFESLELNALHQALQSWRALPVAAASAAPAPAASAPAASTGALPAQVGGC